MVENQRGDNLFMQEDELGCLRETLKEHGMEDGLSGLIYLAKQTGKKYGIDVAPTCDAKYLEVGVTSKSDNVNVILEKICAENNIKPEECTYWGDEYVGIEKDIFGSDSFMKTEKSQNGDFYDVSEVTGERPSGVQKIGGGVDRFLCFLHEQE